MNDLTRRMIGMHACVSWGELPNKIHLVIPDQGGTACGLKIPENVERGWYSEARACLGGHGCKTCAAFVRENEPADTYPENEQQRRTEQATYDRMRFPGRLTPRDAYPESGIR